MILSIIVAVYNVEDYLEKCLDSILDLSDIDYEVILITGNSFDSSNTICDQYQNRHSNISVLHQDGKGLSNARNCGFMAARGIFVVYVDGDDYINAAALKLTISKLKQLSSAPDMVISDFFLVNRKNEIYATRNQIPTTDILIDYRFMGDFLKHKQNFWNVWRTIYRREFLIENTIFFKENTKCEDIDYSTACFLCSSRVYFFHNPYYYYRVRREGSLANVITLESVVDLTTVLETSILKISASTNFPYHSYMIKKLLWEYFYGLSLINDIDKKYKKQACSLFQNKLYLFKYADKYCIAYFLINKVNLSLIAWMIAEIRDIRRKIKKII